METIGKNMTKKDKKVIINALKNEKKLINNYFAFLRIQKIQEIIKERIEHIDQIIKDLSDE